MIVFFKLMLIKHGMHLAPTLGKVMPISLQLCIGFVFKK